MTNNSQTDTLSKLQLTNITKSYGSVKAVRGISLEVNTGQVVAIIGPSGCGKSTLLRCINHLEHPDGGKLRIGDQEIDYDDPKSVLKGKKLAQFRSRFGMVFQQFDLFHHKTVLENITVGQIVVQKKPVDEAKKTARRFLDRVGLVNVETRLPSELSGGQQQRVAIARALALNPEVLLFDEVTSALDPELVGEVLTVIKDLAHEGSTMILVTHEMAFARDVADKVLFIENGRVTVEGAAEEVLISPTNERLKGFLSHFHGATDQTAETG